MPPRTKNPGHSHAQTKHISFTFYSQATSPAPFGYEYFVALPPAYSSSSSKKWPLILFLHGAGESQRGVNESYASVRHGIPKVVLCYDRLMDGVDPPSIDVPRAPRMRRAGTSGDRSAESVSVEVCRLVAEEFVTVTPSLNMGRSALYSTGSQMALFAFFSPMQEPIRRKKQQQGRSCQSFA